MRRVFTIAGDCYFEGPPHDYSMDVHQFPPPVVLFEEIDPMRQRRGSKHVRTTKTVALVVVDGRARPTE